MINDNNIIYLFNTYNNEIIIYINSKHNSLFIYGTMQHKQNQFGLRITRKHRLVKEQHAPRAHLFILTKTANLNYHLKLPEKRDIIQ